MDVKEYIMIGVILFTSAIIFLVISYSYGEVSDRLLNNTQLNYSSDITDSIEGGLKVTSRFDYLILILFIGLILALIIGGYFMGSHPILMFIYFIVIVIVTAMSAIMSYVWDNVADMNLLNLTVTSQFPITNHLISNLPVYSVIIGFIGLVVMFSRPFLQEV